MFRLSDNYYHRKCYFERGQVPTQSVIKKTMSQPLSKVYFKSMTPQLKVLAGLEPPLKGGGTDWYAPPKDLLEGKTVMRPIKHDHISKLSYNGIAFLGEKIEANHKKKMKEDSHQALLESDVNWKEAIKVICDKLWKESSNEAAKKNTQKIRSAFLQFSTMYSTSITKLQNLLFEATTKEIIKTRENAIKKMQNRCETLIKQQATMLYDTYTARLMTEKDKLKAAFVEKVEEFSKITGEKLHDIHYEKHVTIEKIRNLLECQNLACQVYVALKEREQCQKDLELSKHEHKKTMNVLTEQIAMKDVEILIAKDKERKRQEFNKIWQKKVCEVVKNLQMFVAYSLKTLPTQAEFFINMEKLMMIQLNDALENPDVDSIFVSEQADEVFTSIPRPHPFFLFCDKDYKPNLDQNLCPKHCTSSASQLPVIVVNKKCIYAACDNFETFTDKVTQYLYGRRGDDKDFKDDHNYDLDVPVKVTTSKQIQQLKLESSVQQILQNELINIKNVPIKCNTCGIPYCFCNPENSPQMPSEIISETKKLPPLVSAQPSREGITTRDIELLHEREPKWESYLNYVKPKKCKCLKLAKKHLEVHLPPYMRQMSRFNEPYLPHYEACSIAALKAVVKQAQGIRTPPPELTPIPSRTRTTATQYLDPDFDFMCTCFSDDEIEKFFQKYSKMFDNGETQAQTRLATGTVTPSFLNKRTSSFVMERVLSLKHLLGNSLELEEIFRKENCNYS